MPRPKKTELEVQEEVAARLNEPPQLSLGTARSIVTVDDVERELEQMKKEEGEVSLQLRPVSGGEEGNSTSDEVLQLLRSIQETLQGLPEAISQKLGPPKGVVAQFPASVQEQIINCARVSSAPLHQVTRALESQLHGSKYAASSEEIYLFLRGQGL